MAPVALFVSFHTSPSQTVDKRGSWRKIDQGICIPLYNYSEMYLAPSNYNIGHNYLELVQYLSGWRHNSQIPQLKTIYYMINYSKSKIGYIWMKVLSTSNFLQVHIVQSLAGMFIKLSICMFLS